MRVLSALSFLCMSMFGVSGQYVTDPATSFSDYLFSAPAAIAGVSDPALTLTAGQTYTFDVAATSPTHPFAFSATTALNSVAITPIDTNVYTVTTTQTCIGTGTTGAGYQGSGCIVSLAINANAPNSTIYYKCTTHSGMTGIINVVANPTTVTPTTATPTTVTPTTATPTTVTPTTATPTTVTPTTATPTTPGNTTTATPTTATPTTGGGTTATPTTPAPTTGATITGNSFRITGTQGIQAWIFTANGVQYLNPTLNVTAGQDVAISIETITAGTPPPPHPFSFSNISSTASIAPTKDFFPDAFNTWTVNNNMYCDLTTGPARTVGANATNPATNPCVITIKAADVRLGTFYYRCAFHRNMIGTINVVAAGSISSSSSSTGTTGSSTGSSSTGRSSASTVAGAGMALMVAFIATLLA